MDISGTWYNELSSQMNIQVQNGLISGTYQSGVGSGAETFALTGLINTQAQNNAAVGWVVVWTNATTDLTSVTSWSGEVQTDAQGNTTIETTWLLTQQTDAANNWESTLVGKDRFTQQPQILKTGRMQAASHPLK